LIMTSIIIAVLIGSCSFPSSSYTEVREITKDPAKYEGKTVTLRGQVTGVVTLPPMKTKFYMIADGTGEITIMTNEDVPRVKSEVTVEGRVENTAIIEGISTGVHVEELKRSGENHP